MPIRHEPNPPTLPSASSDPSVTAQTPPAGRTPAPHPTGREPTSREYRWSPPPGSPAARRRVPAHARRPSHAAIYPPPDGPAPLPGSGQAYCGESDRGRYSS